jgi:mannonate dehydratase
MRYRKSGLGTEFNEAMAAKFPSADGDPEWTVSRLPDGTLWRP